MKRLISITRATPKKLIEALRYEGLTSKQVKFRLNKLNNVYWYTATLI